MVKAYLRYEHAAQFGVTASSACNVGFSADAKTVYSGALEDVNAWNLRQGTLVRFRPPRSACGAQGRAAEP